ncbi:MAG: DUF1573 domain-containing protein [Bacteroidetes bacterium]|nr:DUF1573 domain-containing protein [Bacteroidota bacterium]
MRRFLPLVLLSLFAMSFTMDGSGPAIKFEKQTHDFGKIPQNKPASYEFVFTNTGDEPLLLTHVKASCGCTTPYYPTRAIQPGESEKIKATYNSRSVGRFTKSITVKTNERKVDGTEGKQYSLQITGEVMSADLEEKNDAPKSPVKQG